MNNLNSIPGLTLLFLSLLLACSNPETAGTPAQNSIQVQPSEPIALTTQREDISGAAPALLEWKVDVIWQGMKVIGGGPVLVGEPAEK